MLAVVKICVLQLNEVVCHISFLSLLYAFIFLVSANFCAQLKTQGISSEISTSRVQNTSSNYTAESLKETKIAEQQQLLDNVSDGLLKTNFTTVTPQDTRHEGVESAEFEYSDDYVDYGNYNLSYVAPEVLVDLEPAEMILSHQQVAPQGRRKPVKDGFERDQEIELLRLHNLYRGNVTPPAADMSFMEWDDRLAKTAQDWANRCEFRHGFPEGNTYPGAMGQNLYMGWDPTGVRALLLWYDEYLYYNLESLECVPLKQCGHYTQMAWGTSTLVGCGMKRCAPRKFLVVCHYSPPGNVIGSAPYVVGKPCSQCQSDNGGLCTSHLCVTEDQCSRNQQNCNPVCPLQCQNCGILDEGTCKCTCADGWDSLDCSRRCTNAHERCGKNPGWPTITTCSMNHHTVADIYCRKMCAKCRDIDTSNSINTCCESMVCDDGYVLDQEENLCNCKLLCPGPKCYKSSGPTDESIPNGNSSSVYESTPNGDSSSVYKSTAYDSGSVYKTTPENITPADSGSWYYDKNIYMILLAVTIQMLLL